MLHHAVVVLIIAVPLGLFAALVATGCRVLRSDLARAGWIGLALLPVLVTGAWEVSLLFWLTAVLCCLIWFLRSIGKSTQYQPSIQTLMAATFLAAVAGLIVGKTGWQSRTEVVAVLMTSIAFAVWASQSVAIACSVDQWRIGALKKWVTRLGLLVAVGSTIAITLAWQDKFARSLSSYGSWPPNNSAFGWMPGFGTESVFDLRWFVIWILGLAIGYSCARIAVRWNLISVKPQPARRNETAGKLRWLFARWQEPVVALAVVIGITSFWVLVRPSGLVLPPADAVAEYRRMDRIAHQMNADLIDVSMLDANIASDRGQFDLQAFDPWRERLRGAMDSHEIRVPLLGYESDIDVDRGQRQRDVARTLAFAARCQIAEGKTDEAIQTLAVGLKWSLQTRRGGLMIDELVSMACGGLPQSILWLHRDGFSDEQRAIAVTEISKVIANRESVILVEQRDTGWAREALGWFGRLYQFTYQYEPDSLGSPFSFENVRHRETASLRLTALELLLACYHREHQQYPESLDQLVWPKELAALKSEFTQDPFRPGERFVYQAKASTYTLYSVGVDGIDQQGFNSIWVSDSTKMGDDIQLKVMYADW